MNKIIRRFCGLAVAVVGIAAGESFGGTVGAAEADAAWAIFGDGCGYLSDGYASYESACPRVDNGWDFYLPDSAGQWSYAFSALTDSSGCTTIFTNAGSLGTSCVQSWADPLGYVGGGTLIDPLGYPVIDAMMTNANNYIIDHTQSPLCIEIDGDTCYT